MAHGNRADAINKNFNVDTKKSVDAEGVVCIKKYQQPEEKPTSELSAFEQVMQQMNIADRDNFDSKYAQLWSEASDDLELLSVLICEIDFFDEYNENYGHQASSFMLLVVALALKTVCEEHGAYLARYKGNEFGILVKGKTAESAHEIAEKLRSAVEKSNTEHKYSEVADIVTLSIGLSSVYPTSMQVEVKQATSALSIAKMSGCNQVSGNLNLRNNRSQRVVNEKVVVEETAESNKLNLAQMMKKQGINNNSDFELHFSSIWKESSRDEELLSMFTCELDHFTEYSQHHGEKTADKLLLTVAGALKKKCDAIGCFMAYQKGARFSVIIHGGNATKGLKVSEMIKTTLQELKLENAASPVKKIFTMSIGLSNIFPSELNTMKMLVSKVEAALKVAKNNGGDQVGVEI
ncbi:diguanylate cyclase [Psychromonas sp. RZ22]|uniref:diguanylate cyclase domain-containing protein n=1 Tax=Psychromonas algarum TaxID=2555643 RepID=UPI001067AD96|nr:diguanylate cyclase [Psychromonas sp. RZ22]TEW56113.1 diguanylate cyclase [Psychromonas sp. RZ22]